MIRLPSYLFLLGDLNLCPETGVISGSLATGAASVTPYAVTVIVDNGNGGSASQAFSWIVNDAALAVQASALNATEGNDPGNRQCGVSPRVRGQAAASALAGQQQRGAD